MTDSTLNRFVARGTNAERVAFTPTPPTPGSGPSQGYFFYETDTGNTYTWDGSAWDQVNNSSGSVTTTGSPASGNLTKFSGASTVTNGDLSGDVTTSGTLATTIANNAVTTAKINNSAVTLAKIANAAANSKLLGSGASGSGSAYAEITLGTGLSMSGTTLNGSGDLGALHLYEERPSGTDGGQGIANVWVTRLLNTTALNTITGASRLSSTVTVTIASPGVFTWNSNNLVNGETIVFTTTGALPTGLAINTTYYVVSAAANTFSVSATQGGAAINTSGSQSGTHTAHTSGIELAAGTYDISARVPCCNAGANTGYKARLYDKTGVATLLEGTSVWGAANTEMESRVQGRFTLSGTSTIRLEMIATAARASGFGINAGITSVNNHFTDVFIKRVA